MQGCQYVYWLPKTWAAALLCPARILAEVSKTKKLKLTTGQTRLHRCSTKAINNSEFHHFKRLQDISRPCCCSSIPQNCCYIVRNAFRIICIHLLCFRPSSCASQLSLGDLGGTQTLQLSPSVSICKHKTHGWKRLTPWRILAMLPGQNKKLRIPTWSRCFCQQNLGSARYQ